MDNLSREVRLFMKNIILRLSKILLILMLSLAIVACVKVTQENYSKIQTGMTMQQVVMILGEPTSSESINIGMLSGTTATWRYGKDQISIILINNQVMAKSFNQPVSYP